ncbi:MAG: sulfite exporter TauE/SafE family protein [Campylobacterota bacterium]|nr:sulfite exporter TauE/SafE family protein [Campylobacterota bacterium]
MIELAFLGLNVGVLSGFFGIGGGTILVPLLLMMGYDMKSAIGIAIVQMVFSSLFGSYVNKKKGTLNISMVLSLGLGGFVGALSSSFLISSFDAKVLEWVFFAFVIFALIRLYFKTVQEQKTKVVHPIILFTLGLIVGAISISIGVGGALLLTPILVGFLHVSLKEAIAAGLFFVVFSSISGLISLSFNGSIDYYHGIIIGIASLFGVYGGIWLKHQTDDILQKRLLVLFYALIATYLFFRLVVNG